MCLSQSLSEALILRSTNPQYDKRFFIDLPVQCMKSTSSEHGENMLCTKIVFVLTFRTIYAHNMFSPCSKLVVFMYWTGKSMNNLLPYCGLLDTRISASEKDLPVQNKVMVENLAHNNSLEASTKKNTNQ